MTAFCPCTGAGETRFFVVLDNVKNGQRAARGKPLAGSAARPSFFLLCDDKKDNFAVERFCTECTDPLL